MNHLTEIIILQHGVNDELAMLVEWLFDNKSYVIKGQPIVTIETTKATFELESPCDGYIRIIGKADQNYNIGEIIGYIAESKDSPLPEITKDLLKTFDEEVESRFTKKALETARKHNLDLRKIKSDRIISEKDILKYVNANTKSHKDHSQLPSTEKIIIYGATHSRASLVDLEIIKHLHGYQVAYYVEDDLLKQGTVIYGINVLSWEQLEDRKVEENINFFFVSIGNSMYRREKLRRCLESGMKPINLIHPSAEISEYAELKSNVLIKRGAIVGPGVSIGDGCIIDNGVTVSHDCKIDSFCHLAPGVSLGSNISINTFSVIGVGASISTGVSIGESVIVTTGAVIVQNVEDQVMMSGNPATVIGKSNIPLP